MSDFVKENEMDSLFNKYDDILNATLANIYTLSKDSVNIVLNDFNYKKTLHRVFLETAFILNTMTQKKIGLKMPMIPFLYFKYIKMRKRKNSLVRVKENTGIDIETVADFEASAFESSLTIFNDIYNAYYKMIY